MPRQLLVLGDKNFKVTVPDDAKITFGPWSPPPKRGSGGHGWEAGDKRGTLRIYQGTEKNVLAVFSGVHGFRDLTLGYAEEVAREEGSIIWKDDEKGYVRENRVASKKEWIEPVVPMLAKDAEVPRRAKRR